MQIGNKILVFWAILFSIFIVSDLIVQEKVIMPGFYLLEREEAIKDIVRSTSAIESEFGHLDNLNYDWAAWDDTYKFIQDLNTDYIESNLVDSSFTDNHLNLIYLLNKENKVVWGKAVDLETEEDIDISEFPLDVFPTDHPLLGLDNVSSFHAGIIITSSGPMLVSARPILTSEIEGPSRGTLIMGRLLTPEYINRISEQTQNSLNIWTIGSESFPDKYKDILPRLAKETTPVLSEISDSELEVLSSIKDVNNNAALMLKLDIRRDISLKGREISYYSFWWTFSIVSLLTAIFLIVLRNNIVLPLNSMIKHITNVGRSYDLQIPLEIKGCHEIEQIADQFNLMSKHLHKNRREMIDHSYSSGMAEITSGVIHNIRNTITPLTADIALLKEKCDYLPIENMTTAYKELGNDDLDPGRKKKLDSFFEKSLIHIADLKDTVITKISLMEEHSALTSKLLDDLEEFAHAGFVPEKFSIKQLLDDASALFHNRFLDISIEINIDGPDTIKSHRSVLVMIFMNLLYNAGDSINLKGEKNGKLMLSAINEQIEGEDIVHFELHDNGQGIAANDLPEIFKRGYSTKGKKVSGIGLHWCANTVTTLRGKMYAESDGIGSGARIHIILPVDISV